MEARRINQATVQDARPMVSDTGSESSSFGAQFHALIQSLVGGTGSNPLLANLDLIPAATLAAPVEAKPEISVEDEVEAEVEEEIEAEVTAEGEDDTAETEEALVAAQVIAANAAPVQSEESAPLYEIAVEEQAPVLVMNEAVPEAELVETESGVEEQALKQLLVPQQQQQQQQTVTRETGVKTVAEQVTQVEAEVANDQARERQTLADVETPAVVAQENADSDAATGPTLPKSKNEIQSSQSNAAARAADSEADLAKVLASSADAQLAPTDGVTQTTQQSLHRATTGVAGAAATMTAAELQLRAQSALAGSSESLGLSSAGKGSVDGVALLQAAQGERGMQVKGKGATTGLPRADQEKILQQIRDVMKKASQSADGNTMVVRLDPPELGNITVKVTQRDGQVFARIIPENADVEQLLRQRANEVTQALAAVGLRVDHVQLSIGRERSESETFRFQEQHGSGGGNQTGEQGGSSSGSEGGNRSADMLPKGKGPKSGLAADTAEVGWVA